MVCNCVLCSHLGRFKTWTIYIRSSCSAAKRNPVKRLDVCKPIPHNLANSNVSRLQKMCICMETHIEHTNTSIHANDEYAKPKSKLIALYLQHTSRKPFRPNHCKCLLWSLPSSLVNESFWDDLCANLCVLHKCDRDFASSLYSLRSSLGGMCACHSPGELTSSSNRPLVSRIF